MVFWGAELGQIWGQIWGYLGEFYGTLDSV